MSKEIASKQLQNWSDRITDRGNLWLAATNLEDDGNFAEAAKLYLRDATWCSIKTQLARAALSSTCAARCLGKIGHPQIAQALYLQAGTLYENNAYSILDKSIRESLWSFQRAYESLLLAKYSERAQEMLYKYTSLASKISPFFDVQQSLRMLGFNEIQTGGSSPDKTELGKTAADGKTADGKLSTKRELSPDLALSINTFLEATGSELRLKTSSDTTNIDVNNNTDHSTNNNSDSSAGKDSSERPDKS